MQHTWIFQLKEALTDSQRELVEADLMVLMREWKAHGSAVPGESTVYYNRFVMVQAEPGATTGCSIDSMNRGVESVLSTHGAAVLPHNFVFYRKGDEQLDYMDFREVQGAIQSGDLHPATTVYDSTLGQANDPERWEIKLADCWLSRYLPETTKS